MKTLISTLISCVLSCASYGQKIRFSDISNKWNILITLSHPADLYKQYDNLKFTYAGSVVDNGFTYSILTCSNSGPDTLLIREDTIANIVYKKYPNQTEQVLYNYNMKVGDTIGKDYQSNYHAVVQAIDTLMIDNNPYRLFRVAADGLYQEIIEGIGNLHDIRQSYATAYTGTYIRNLICFENNGAQPSNIIVFNYSNLKLDRCGDSSLNLKNFETRPRNINLYPQPAIDKVTIQLPNVMTGTLYFFNLQGRLVVRRLFHNEKQLEIGKQQNTSGLYFYKITDTEQNISYTGKVVFE